ncbi:MAG: ATP-binding cassette domain-containing protein [Clostridia bacterium]|nr:ATP-binding cassette domain-containing protein [Clostridia bacterium]
MIEIRNLTKTFSASAQDGSPVSFDALKNVSLTVGDGDIYGIIGMSGAGKSTLVRCINMLERPTEGQVLIDGVDVGALNPRELRAVRREVTMIFQGFNLLMQRTCLANITFPLELSGMKRAEAKKKAVELLETVGLPDKANAYPAQLSGGQQQRIALARALATNPKVLLCDEATSALDPNTTHAILELIRKINRELGITVIIITHQMSVVEEVCSHVAILDAGEVVEQGEVAEVFANPKSDAAKRLVYPDAGNGADDDAERSAGIAAAARAGERVLRVVFNGSHTTDKPFITQMAIDTGIAANILYASTRCLGDRVFGDMLLGIPGDDRSMETVLSYFAKDTDILIEAIGEEGDCA